MQLNGHELKSGHIEGIYLALILARRVLEADTSAGSGLISEINVVFDQIESFMDNPATY